MAVFAVLLVLALTLSFLALKVRLILFRLASILAWLVLGILLLTSPDTIGVGAIGLPWVTALGFVFLVMIFAIVTLHWSTELTRNQTSKIGSGYPGAGTSSWKEWGPKPKMESESRSARVKRERKEKMRALSGRRRR